MKFLNRFMTLALAFCAFTVSAEQYPTRPITLVVGYTPGGAVDTIARMLANTIDQPLGQSIIVENRPGASGNISMEHVAKAKPDGYTLMMTGSPLVVAHALFENLPFDTTKDFAPITMAVQSPNVLVVGKDFPADTIEELFDMARNDPDALSYAATSPLFLLAAEVISKRAGIEMLRVPYKGAGDALMDVMESRVSVMIDTIGNQLPHIRRGSVKPLAVLGASRHPELPDVPTLDESGLPGYEEDGWIGLAAPADTPPEVLARLNKEVVTALHSDAMHSKLTDMGFIVRTMTPEETSERVKQDVQRYIKAAEDAGLPRQ